jgi:hypothetical protein
MNKNIKTKEKKNIKHLDTQRQYCLNQPEKMDSACNNNEAKKLYQKLKRIRRGFKPQTLLIRDKYGNTVSNKEKVLQRWSEYYETHLKLQDGTDSDCGEECEMRVQIAERCAEPPNNVDIEMSLSKFKNGKANGHDQIAAQLIKEGEEELKKVTYKLISKIQEEEITPHERKYGIIICPIHQKGDVYTSYSQWHLTAN